MKILILNCPFRKINETIPMMWKVEYKKGFLKELSKLPEGIQAQAEKVVLRTSDGKLV